MTSQEAPQLYLTAPAQGAVGQVVAQITPILDQFDIACLRLPAGGRDEDTLSRLADTLREIAHGRDIPIVLDDHYRLAAQLGLDGVHLTTGAREVRQARAHLHKDAIVGAYCGASRHQGMTAGEIGADYISFGPVAESALGSGEVADQDLFAWWAEMIELPVIAEGGLSAQAVEALKEAADFLCFGEEIWGAEQSPQDTLKACLAPL
ncbi:MAG: thiamine phosphate synthase [Pseudomonadota bacterium]